MMGLPLRITILFLLGSVPLSAQYLLQANSKQAEQWSYSAVDTLLYFSTDFAKMQIPFHQLDSVCMGAVFSYTAKDAQRINNELNRMRYEDDSTSEFIFKQLSGLNEAVLKNLKAYMQQAGYEPDTSRPFTVERLYALIQTKSGMAELPSGDLVFLHDGSRLEGLMDPLPLVQPDSARPVFNRDNIRSFSCRPAQKSKEWVLWIYPDKHVTAKDSAGWLYSGIHIEKGQSYQIQVSGTIELAAMAGLPFTADGAMKNSAPPMDADFHPAQLLFRIGPSEPMMTGLSCLGQATSSGELLFSIYESLADSANAGQYRIHIKIY